jgi:DNA-binding transcriptional ArsR family regulator
MRLVVTEIMGGTDEEDLHQEIKELTAKIRELEDIVARIQQPIEQMRSFTKKYIGMVDAFLRMGVLPEEKLFSDVSDDISRDILKVLLRRSDGNISQITEAVRERRGSASRRIVRERLKKLQEQGKVQARREKNVTFYRLSPDLVQEWSRLLGFFK